jgi:hypothetical protein
MNDYVDVDGAIVKITRKFLVWNIVCETLSGGMWTRVRRKWYGTRIESRPIPGNPIKNISYDSDKDETLITTRILESITDLPELSERTSYQIVSDLIVWLITTERQKGLVVK